MNKKIIGIIILVLLIAIMVGIKALMPSNDDTNLGNGVSSGEDYSNLTQVTVATGGGKEGFLANEKVLDIMRNKYGINPVYDSWSN